MSLLYQSSHLASLSLAAASLPSSTLSLNLLKHLAQLERSRRDMIKCLTPTAQSFFLSFFLSLSFSLFSFPGYSLHHKQAEQVFAELHKMGRKDCSPSDHYCSPIFLSLSLFLTVHSLHFSLHLPLSTILLALSVFLPSLSSAELMCCVG